MGRRPSSRTRVPRRRNASAADDGIRLLRRHSRRSGRACRRSSPGDPRVDATPASVESARAVGRARHRRARARHRLREQRPAGHDARGRGAHLRRGVTRCGPDRAPSCSPTTTARTPTALALHGAGVEVAAIVDPRSGASLDGALPLAAREAGLPIIAKSAIVGARGTLHVAAVDVVPLAGGSAAAHRLRSRRPVRRLEPCRPSSFAGARQASLRRRARDVRSRRLAVADRVRRRGEWPRRSRRRAGGRSCGAGSPPQSAPGWPPIRCARRRRMRAAVSGGAPQALWSVRARREGGEALRRLAERRHRRRHRAGRARRLPVGRASRSATRRSAWAPTRARYPTSSASRCSAKQLGRPIAEVGTTTFRPPYTPVTLGAFPGIDAGTHVEPTRYTAMHDWHVAHGARFVNAGLWKRPHSYPRAGEIAGRRGGARGAQRPRQRRRRRRIHARQDRAAGTRRRGIPESRLHQPLGHARRRAAAGTA